MASPKLCILKLALAFLTIMAGHMLARCDIRMHLATKTRYAFKTSIPNAPSIYATPDPAGYEPLHMWLLSRHGTRWPTDQRMAQINTLEKLFKDARNTAQYPWIKEWQSPVKTMLLAGGELHTIGEDEMWALAQRLRTRFPSLVSADYYPNRYSIVSTQVHRTSASASAFASGFFPEVHTSHHENASHMAAALRSRRSTRRKMAAAETLGRPAVDGGDDHLVKALTTVRSSTRPQAIALTMAPKHKDPLLRFYDTCPQYAVHEEYTEAWMSSWMASNWTKLTPKLEARLGMARDLDPCEVDALWQLCLMEAGLLNEVQKGCSLFTDKEVALLEWINDVELMESHGYGSRINYEIASPLLADLHKTLKDVANEDKPFQQARLLFAHCETLVPLASLMGLFQEPGVEQRSAAGGDDEGHLEDGGSAASVDLLHQADAIEDLGLHMAKARTATRRRRSESDESGACNNGKPVDPGDHPVPPGWQPSVPFDSSRLWRGARVSPFGANMAVVLYREKGGNGRSSHHKVRLIYNEQIIPVPGCSSSRAANRPDMSSSDLDCDLDEFLELYADLADPDIMTRECAVAGVADSAMAAAA